MAKDSTLIEPHHQAIDTFLEKLVRQTTANGYSLDKRLKKLNSVILNLSREVDDYDRAFDGSIKITTYLIADTVFYTEFFSPLIHKIIANMCERDFDTAYAMASFLKEKYKALYTAGASFAKEFAESGQTVYDFDKVYYHLLNAVGRE